MDAFGGPPIEGSTRFIGREAGVNVSEEGKSEGLDALFCRHVQERRMARRPISGIRRTTPTCRS